MFIHIDPSSGLAIYEQVARQMKYAIASEVLRSGELIPSVRELSKELAINPNTVARAYRQLQEEGVLETVRGTGLSVAAGAVEQCQADRIRLIRQRLGHVFLEAERSRLSIEKIRQLVDDAFHAISQKDP